MNIMNSIRTLSHSFNTASVFFPLGTHYESGVRLLKDEENRAFKRGSSLTFVMSTEKNLGELVYLRIWIDNTGGDWYLRYVGDELS